MYAAVFLGLAFDLHKVVYKVYHKWFTKLFAVEFQTHSVPTHNPTTLGHPPLHQWSQVSSCPPHPAHSLTDTFFFRLKFCSLELFLFSCVVYMDRCLPLTLWKHAGPLAFAPVLFSGLLNFLPSISLLSGQYLFCNLDPMLYLLDFP